MEMLVISSKPSVVFYDPGKIFCQPITGASRHGQYYLGPQAVVEARARYSGYLRGVLFRVRTRQGRLGGRIENGNAKNTNNIIANSTIYPDAQDEGQPIIIMTTGPKASNGHDKRTRTNRLVSNHPSFWRDCRMTTSNKTCSMWQS